MSSVADPSNNEQTLQTYESYVDRYLSGTPTETPSDVVEALQDLADALPDGADVLEIGSGPGRDADLLESFGVRVHRTDATAAFVERLRAEGHSAEVRNVIHDSLGGPYDGVIALAVLLHVDRDDLPSALRNIAAALLPGGRFLGSLMEGAGEEWSTHKMDAPRHFVFWSEEEFTALLAAAGLSVDLCRRHTSTRGAQWLTFLTHKG